MIECFNYNNEAIISPISINGSQVIESVVDFAQQRMVDALPTHHTHKYNDEWTEEGTWHQPESYLMDFRDWASNFLDLSRLCNFELFFLCSNSWVLDSRTFKTYELSDSRTWKLYDSRTLKTSNFGTLGDSKFWSLCLSDFQAFKLCLPNFQTFALTSFETFGFPSFQTFAGFPIFQTFGLTNFKLSDFKLSNFRINGLCDFRTPGHSDFTAARWFFGRRNVALSSSAWKIEWWIG